MSEMNEMSERHDAGILQMQELDRLRAAVIHAARDVEGLWFPQDDNQEGTDLTFWGPEAGEALRDLRDAIQALDAFEGPLLDQGRRMGLHA